MPRTKVKPFVKGKVSSKPKAKQETTKIKIESPETDVMRRIIPLKEGFFPYGKIGLVNYAKKVKKGFMELDVLRPANLPPTKLNLQTVVDTQKKNFFTIYNSGWRLMFPTNYGVNIDYFSEFKGMVNRVHVLTLNDLLVSFHDREELWLKHNKKIFEAMPYELDRFAQSFHSTRTVILFPEMKQLTKRHVELFYNLWRAWKFPFSDYPSSITFRFNVFTSSIPGRTVRDKLAFIESQSKYFKHMVCLIGDDMSLFELATIAKHVGIRCTFDPTKCKDDGKFITADNSRYAKTLRFATPPASSLNPPPIFLKKDILNIIKDTDKGMKILKHYSKISNVVLY